MRRYCGPQEEHVDGVKTDESEVVGLQSDEFAVEQDETESVSLRSDEEAQKGAGEKPEQAAEAGVQAGRPRYHGWEACQLLNVRAPPSHLFFYVAEIIIIMISMLMPVN
jgi:hypothetical protein